MEIELIEKTINMLSELDFYLEKLEEDNLEKINICSKNKELIFWLTYYKEILKYWQKIVDIEDDIEREIEMNMYSEEMPFKEITTLLNLISKLQKEIEALKAKLEFKQFGDLDNAEFEKYIDEYKKNDYIPKSKIEDRIKECETNIKNLRVSNDIGSSIAISTYQEWIVIYKELLESEE